MSGYVCVCMFTLHIWNVSLLCKKIYVSRRSLSLAIPSFMWIPSHSFQGDFSGVFCTTQFQSLLLVFSQPSRSCLPPLSHNALEVKGSHSWRAIRSLNKDGLLASVVVCILAHLEDLGETFPSHVISDSAFR